MSTPSDPPKPPAALDAIVDRVLAYNPKKDRQMSEPTGEGVTRLDAKVEALYDVVRIILQHADTNDLGVIYRSLMHRLDSLGDDVGVDSIGAETRREAFEDFRRVIKDTGRLR